MTRRNAALVLMTLFGVAAVVTLFELRRGGASGARAVAAGTTRGGGRPAARLAPPRRPPPPPRSLPTEKERERAARTIEEVLAGTAPSPAEPGLERLLELAGRRASPAIRARLLEMVKSGDPQLRERAADVLGRLEGDVETARALVGLLRDAPDAGPAILSALGRMGVREVTLDLLGMIDLGLPDEPLLIRTVGRLAAPEELERLLPRLGCQIRADSRQAIEQALEEREPGAAFHGKVAAALADAGVKERRSLLRILSASPDPAHAALMRDLLTRRTDAESRAIAIRALGRHGDPESLGVLLDLVQEGRPDDRRHASQAILSIRDADTVERLRKEWRRLSADGRAAVMGAMARLPSPTADMIEAAANEGLRDAEPRVRAAAARVLGERGEDGSVVALADALARTTQPAEVGAALAALEEIGTSTAALAGMRALDAVADGRGRDGWRERFRRVLEQGS